MSITPSEIINPLDLDEVTTETTVIPAFDSTTGEVFKHTVVGNIEDRIATLEADESSEMKLLETPADGYILQSDENGQAESSGLQTANIVTASANLATDKIVLGGGANKTVKDSGVGIEYLVPTGSILSFGGAIASLPTGFLACNGSAVSRTTYNTLFALIGTTFGVGDNSTTFNLPDFQGRSPKGVGTSSGGTDVTHVEEIITLGTKNNDKLQGHAHNLSKGGSGSNITGGVTNHVQGSDGINAFVGNGVTTVKTDGTNGTPRTGTITTGKTLGVNFIIKH